jgi:hypothetical protein
MKTLIKKSMCRRHILEYAQKNRSHVFTRVDPNVYIHLDFKIREHIRNIVSSQPSKGKTISI